MSNVLRGAEPENVEHRMRPEDAAARDVPVPQAAAAAIERGVDAAAHHVVDSVGLAGPRRLPVEGKAEDQHDKSGGGEQRCRQRCVRAPRTKVLSTCGWTTASWPSGALRLRTVANAASPLLSVISRTPASAPNVVSGCVGTERVEKLRPMADDFGQRGDDVAVERR